MNQTVNQSEAQNRSFKYVSYLQNLLKEKNITFLSQTQFQQSLNSSSVHSENHINQINTPVIALQQNKEQQRSSKKLLTSNLQQTLNGRLLERYSRQMLLKQIAYPGQLKIVNAKIALIGSGGIGCPLALYLAGAGVGTLGLFDSDTIEVTNLHRQIAHKNSSLGMKKTQSLKRSILQFNPYIKVNTHQFVTLQNMHQLSQYDFVIDGSDNPQCRYIVNDYCMRNDKKLLSGACIGWQGQVTCYGGKIAPCYRCIWGNQQKTSGGCSALGVIGMLPGIVGLILATQALKLIINDRTSLEGNLLTFDCREMNFRKLKIRPPVKDCIGCGQTKLNMHEYDYSIHALCAPNSSPLPKVQQISWEQYLQKEILSPILDVRPPNHFNICHLKNMISLPYQKLTQMNHQNLTSWIRQNFRNSETDQIQQSQIYISCNRGVTSKRACQVIQKAGFKAISIIGGITEYSKKIDPQIPIL